MGAQLLAELLLLLHFLFILFVVFGAFLVLHWRRIAWLHLPAVAWGVWIEASHGICPLTPLENHYRIAAGEAGYSESFMEHYLNPVIYPQGINDEIQIVLAILLLLFNLAIYTWVIARR